jgi:hypothetical protein
MNDIIVCSYHYRKFRNPNFTVYKIGDYVFEDKIIIPYKIPQNLHKHKILKDIKQIIDLLYLQSLDNHGFIDLEFTNGSFSAGKYKDDNNKPMYQMDLFYKGTTMIQNSSFYKCFNELDTQMFNKKCFNKLTGEITLS